MAQLNLQAEFKDERNLALIVICIILFILLYFPIFILIPLS